LPWSSESRWSLTLFMFLLAERSAPWKGIYTFEVVGFSDIRQAFRNQLLPSPDSQRFPLRCDFTEVWMMERDSKSPGPGIIMEGIQELQMADSQLSFGGVGGYVLFSSFLLRQRGFIRFSLHERRRLWRVNICSDRHTSHAMHILSCFKI
jgi:hypothetical protein